MSDSRPETTEDRVGDRYRCYRRCADGSICDKYVPLPGIACYHHTGQRRVGAGDSAPDRDGRT